MVLKIPALGTSYGHFKDNDEYVSECNSFTVIKKLNIEKAVNYPTKLVKCSGLMLLNPISDLWVYFELSFAKITKISSYALTVNCFCT